MTPCPAFPNKSRHYSMVEAKATIRGGMRKYLHAYHCPYCGFYHVGHKRWAPTDMIANLQLDEDSDACI